MICYDRIGVSEGIDVYKTSKLKECDICHYWYFLNKGFKFQPNACNELFIMSMNVSHISILNIRESDYCCIVK